MDIKYGVQVVDKNGKLLGTVNHTVRDSWTGEIRKYFIYREAPETDLSFSPGDISEVTELKATLKIAFDETGKKSE
jgi:hypothetical protein